MPLKVMVFRSVLSFRILTVTCTTVTAQLSSILAGGVIGEIWKLYLMIICQIFGSILNKSEVLLEFS